ncbi:MAG: CHRD domain-containing protein [Bacteroidota bacterium]|nr:CHRD domain-containing protein [Bacteroidota bacterium]
MKLFTKTILSAALAIFSFAASAQLSGRMLVTARIDGMQNGVNTKASGVATVMLSRGLDTACINISWNGLSGTLTGIHTHEGMPGQSGNVVNDLSAYVSGNHLSATFTGATLTKQWIAKLLSNQLYVNIHTAANPNGEIRGQLMVSTDWSFVAQLDNVQAATTSKAYGLGVFNLSADRKRMWYQIVVQDLTDTITGIHLHNGAMGQSGGVAVDLGNDVKGKVIGGWIAVDSTLLKNLMKGDIYVNVHNASNAGGEIRGQLMPPRRIMAYSWIDGKQAGITTNAKGVASIQMNLAADTAWYDIVVDGLSDTIASIHFHYGAAGQSGAVAVDLDGGVMGNHIKGMITGASLNPLFIGAMVTNNIYVNIHTSNNAGGEIRGQVMRLAREGFTIWMDGAQNNVTGATGTGSGYVSIDAMGLNAEVLVVMDNMTEAPTAIHFHKGPKGGSGGVILDLAGWLMKNGKGGTVWGHWENNASSNPFGMAEAMLFWHDSVYINAHTTANAGGEIRGQVLWGSGCYKTTTGIAQAFYNNNNATNISVYPNPANDILNIALPQGSSYITIYDATGRMVYNQTASNQNQIATSNMQSGIYYIRAISGGENFNASFIKN